MALVHKNPSKPLRMSSQCPCAPCRNVTEPLGKPSECPVANRPRHLWGPAALQGSSSGGLLFRRACVYTPCSWASPWHLHLLFVASAGPMSYSHLLFVPHFEPRSLLFYVWIMISICLPVQETPETWIWSRGQEDPLEKGTATHSSNLAWRIPWTEELGKLQSVGSQRAGHDCASHLLFFFFSVA